MLPASRLNAQGQPVIDLWSILKIAFPLFIQAGLQAALNLIDTWFVGRISVDALAGVGGVYWLVLGLLFFLTGIGMAVQTRSAQFYGAGRRNDAAAEVWSGLYIALFAIPLCLLLAWLGQFLVPLLGVSAAIQEQALAYWSPRVWGGPFIIAETAVLAFFMGIGRVKLALLVNIFIVVVNTVLNAIFVFGLRLGVEGIAWATTFSIGAGLIFALLLFLAPSMRAQYNAHKAWRLRPVALKGLLFLGLPIGFSIGVDILGFAVFQAMMTRLGAIEGAASQVVIMLTSAAFLPAVGLGKAGTTLVGQSIGAGEYAWARRLGNRVIALCVVYMFLFGLLLAIFGHQLVQWFISPNDPSAQALIALGAQLALIAAFYQVFDGLHLGAVFCLRGAGDAKTPALVLFVLSWGFFIPLTYLLTFAPGQGWFDSLPAFGYGAVGGWWAANLYIFVLSVFLAWRWWKGAVFQRVVA